MSHRISRRDVFKRAAASGAAAAGLTRLAQGQEETSETASPAPPPPPAEADRAKIKALLEGNQAVKWVFAGDSITHGARHLNGWRDYPQLFEERLRYEMGKERNLVIRTATSGWTIGRLSEDLEWRVLQFAPQVASFHFGMNDCTAGDDALPAFRELYPRIIAKVRETCGSAILIHTPNPVLPNSETRRAPYIDAYVAAIREIAAEVDAILVDHYAAWAEYGKEGEVYYLMNDPLHPNEYGHRFKAELLFKELGMYDPNCAVSRLLIPR
jgi:lysophospholipase L1-like esterase